MGPLFWGMGLGSPSNKIVQKPATGGSWEDYLRTNHMPGGMSPQSRVNEGHGSFSRFDDAFGQLPKAGASQGLIPKFMEMLHGRAAAQAAPASGAAPTGAPPAIPTQQEMDASTARWAGSPETNPLLRPMGGNNSGQRLPWTGGPFSGMLDSAYDAGKSPDAGLIPKFVNLMGNM